MHYNAAIGKSIYQISYNSGEDLSMLQDLCKKINSIVNLILATDKTMTNEKALLLALIDIFFELQSYKNSVHEKQYTSKDILEIISNIHHSVLLS